MKLQNKRALITGGNSGIGLATAQLFVAEGARVAILGRSQAKLEAAVKSLGDGNIGLQADAKDNEATNRAITQAAEQLGGLDIVIANAGIGGMTPLGQTTLEAFEDILKTNVTGVFFTVQAASPYLSSGASIVIVGSVHAGLGAAGYSAYAASKGAVRTMVRVLAAELSPREIRVNLVSPGPIQTPIWDKYGADAFAALEKNIAAIVPLGRFGRAEEVAKSILFLASDDSTYIQAADLAIDGGMNGAPAAAPIFRVKPAAANSESHALSGRS